jgi:hypothetical protein
MSEVECVEKRMGGREKEKERKKREIFFLCGCMCLRKRVEEGERTLEVWSL